METDYLFNYLNSIRPLSPDLKKFLLANLIFDTFNIGDQLPYRPPISTTLYFVNYGLLSGTHTQNHNKSTLWFSKEGSFILPLPNSTGKQFIDRIEFLKPTLLIGLESPLIQRTIDEFPETLSLFIRIIEQNRIESNNRELFLRLPSQERCSQLFNLMPNLFIDSNSDQLASYLNISKRQLMRIKPHLKTK